MNLTPTDLATHAALGITPQMLARAQVCRVDDPSARERLTTKHSGDLSGILYPYLHPNNGHATTYRLRRDHPEMEHGTPKDKYLSAWGNQRHLYFPPGCAALLADVTVALFMVEAEKSVLSIMSAAEHVGRAVFAVGTGGCWGWRGVIGKTEDANGARVAEKGPLPDFALITWTGRHVVIAFDANAATNEKVQVARRMLAKELTARGAVVRIIDIPAEPGINGPDDYIGAHGSEAFFALVDSEGRDAVDLILSPADPMPSAEAFVARAYTVDDIRTLHHQAGVFYGYQPEAGAYQQRDEAAVRADLYKFLKPTQQRIAGTKSTPSQLTPFQPTKSKVENVIDALRAVCNLPTTQMPPCWLAHDPGLDPLDMLAFPNGLLHIPTRTLHPPTPEFFTLNGLDFPYDADAPRPCEWLAFLCTLWGEDAESISTLQEAFGYILTPDTRFEKILMMVGPKRSGKGVTGRVARRLVGERNTCSPTLAAFGRDFGKQVLVGKALAVISDARISGRTDTAMVAETLLSISGEDPQTIPRKFLPDWDGKLGVRFLLLTNELPRITDASGALASRFIVLALKESFYGKEDPGLFNRFVPELPGILNWALEGRDRLYDRGYFVQPESAKELMQEFMDLGSPEATFLRQSTRTRPGATVSQKALFLAWISWCQENGRDQPGTAQTFGRNVRAVLPFLTTRQLGGRGEQERCWEGLELLDSRTCRSVECEGRKRT